jgi:8-oxo-dGTP diphosphatase
VKESIIKLASNFVKQKFVYAGVPVIIQNSKKEILLGKRGKKVLSYPGIWGLPGGMLDYEEKLIDAVRREVKEELGIDVKIIRRAKNIYENPPTKECKFHMIDIPYYAKIVNGIPKPKDETSEVKWFKPSEIRDMKLAYGHKNILKGEGLI